LVNLFELTKFCLPKHNRSLKPSTGSQRNEDSLPFQYCL